jgi:hypothetical protein
MITTNKIIMVLVEGQNDLTSLTQCLGYLVKKRYSDREVRLAVVGTDLLQHEAPEGEHGALELVYGQVEAFLSQNKLDWENLVEVIEICDVDGVYLADGLLQAQAGSIVYQDRTVLCADVDYIKDRNARKRKNIDSLLADHFLYHAQRAIPFGLKAVFPFSTYQESWDALRNETTRIPRWSNLNVWLPSVTTPLIH